VQIRVATLTLAGLAGAGYVGAAFRVAPALAGRAALVAFAALAAGALAARVRSAIPLALGVLAIGVGVIVERDLSAYGWFAYAPLTQPRPVSLNWSLARAPHARLAVALLAAAVLLTVAAVGSPRTGRRRPALLALVLLPAAGYVAVRAVAVAGRQPAGTGPALADMALGAWALLLATVTLAVAAALGRGWRFTAGTVLVALVALGFIDAALGMMPVPETIRSGAAILAPGMISGTGPRIGRSRDWAEAAAAAALFAGGLLAVLGLAPAGSAPDSAADSAPDLPPAVVPPEDPGDGVEA
jgi:hypothetical protein